MKYSLRRIRLSYIAWFRYTRFFNQSMTCSNRHLAKWGLRTGQFDIISHLKEGERVTQSELANRLVVTNSNITQILSKLEVAGFIQREQEWKTKYISLTPKGVALRNEIVPAQEQFRAGQFENLTEDELEQLIQLLKKANQGVHEE
ncbi:MarR family transcriptional regulator [Lysinibacillus sp. KCTC 33748]|uniref:MarR family winged helix-turn-helix transcriptional regulator n=1 Tax=unclassified Lysinibacillus TaxID=2636778 RepID=UPI0009A84414|nr:MULTISPECIES: MarR family winged helix-turn-helix transcriptional regulator [unclassified Lysinibacillus]OXS72196.1 MarR family transcriptional regulator [Lysinibacillus sp. KCTC 33748]SKB98365.1 transcriptional regulator, MarR family [Lysinibacillus sp. AC-3]